MPSVHFRQFRLLWVVLASCGCFGVVLPDFRRFWLVLGAGFGWLRVLLLTLFPILCDRENCPNQNKKDKMSLEGD